MRVLLVSAVVVLLAAVPSRGDGLLYRLPKDGTWASYAFDGTMWVSPPSDKTAKVNGSVRLASVGQITTNGEPCRWIEVTFEMNMEMGDRKEKERHTAKVLIPEKHLTKGKDPLDHVIRAWVQGGNSRAKKLKDPNGFSKEGLFPLVFAPALKNVKQLEGKMVSSKFGELACSGITGTAKFAYPRGEGEVTFENRLHPKSPFGVVASRWDIKDRGHTAMIWNLKLSELGDGAKSELPEEP